MSFNRKQEDRKKRRVSFTDKQKQYEETSRSKEKQKLKMGNWNE